ncbi:hypothetical protein [Streptomyces malaysiensis]|nr:hypothetical protein R8789_39035 [Streptomyces malaysiensis]
MPAALNTLVTSTSAANTAMVSSSIGIAAGSGAPSTAARTFS